jgi:hypothetical protein
MQAYLTGFGFGAALIIAIVIVHGHYNEQE